MSEGKFRVAIYASGDPETGGGGSTMDTFIRNCALGLVVIEVGLVICNNSRRVVPDFYKKLDVINDEYDLAIQALTINSSRYPAEPGEVVTKGSQTVAEAKACADAIEEDGANLFLLAGYMKRVRNLKKKGLNTHPGPISDNPRADTKGKHGIGVQEEIFRLDLPYSAHTVHEVVEEYDSGKVVAVRRVLRKSDDTPQTLFDRVQIVEKACLPTDVETYLLSQRDLVA